MINQFVSMCVSVSVCVCIGVCCACVLVCLTLWLGDKSLLVRPSWFDGRWEGWLTPWPFCVGRRSSVSGAPVSGLMSDGCSGHAGPWLSDRAGWPPSALTLYASLRPSVKHPLHLHHHFHHNPTPVFLLPRPSSPSQSEAGTQDLSSGLFSCCTS